MALKNFTAGEELEAPDVDVYMVNTLFAFKPGNESVASSTTLQNDDDLFLTLAANADYELTGLLRVDGSSVDGNIKMRFTGPTDWSPLIYLHGITPSATDGASNTVSLVEAAAAEPTFGTTGVGTNWPVYIHGLVRTVAGGTFRIQWAQATSSANATRVAANSWMTARRVS